MGGLLLIALILFVLIIMIGALVRNGILLLKHDASFGEVTLGLIYFYSFFLFVLGFDCHRFPFYQAVTVEYGECYSFVSIEHLPTLLFYFIVFNISLVLTWCRSNRLAPLVMLLAMIFIVIGIMINLTILVQISEHHLNSTQADCASPNDYFFFLLTPMLGLIIGVFQIFKTVSSESALSVNRTYSNKFLQKINDFLATRSRNPVWIVLLILPVFLIVTLILVVFGQETDSIIKVFTDTATWKLSQKSHPPPLDHRGHYLCTVAACGSPKIVKPLRIGQRSGEPILVNRQLLIANAFEELIQDFSPRLHAIIRTNYDKYGYNLSKKITTPLMSNLTYVLMKPIEWFFLLELL